MFRLLVQIKPRKRVTGRSSKKTEEIVDLEKEELDAIALSGKRLLLISLLVEHCLEMVTDCQLTTFAAAREALLDPGPDLVVCDEGHRIKNERTGIAAALSAIKTR